MRSLSTFRRRKSARRDEDVASRLLVDSIDDGFLHIRDEGARIVLEANGINFDLRSEHEQRSLLDVMAELLSYLPDPIQILVRSRVYEPNEYFDSLEPWRDRWLTK